MDLNNLNPEQRKGLSESMLQRASEIEGMTRHVVIELVVRSAIIYNAASEPKVKLNAATVLNVVANFAHELGLVPRDVTQEALRRLSEDEDEDASDFIHAETARRTVAKMGKAMRGEEVPDDDGIFIGYRVVEE